MIYVFDLDGTLAESKQKMDVEMAGLIKDLLQHSKVAIVSGAAFRQFDEQVISALDSEVNASLENLSLFPENGSACYLWKDNSWQVQYHEKFSPAESAEIIAALKKEISDAGLDKVKTYGEQIEDRGGQITFSGLGQQAPIDVKSTFDPDTSIRTSLANKLRSILPQYEIRVGGMTSVDITRKGITKLYAIKKIEGMFSVGAADITYIGDALFPGGNDFAAIESGARTVQVNSIADTKEFIRSKLVAHS